MPRTPSAALKERLFQVTLEHIRSRGYGRASVSHVTSEVDVAKGTFFNYFKTKDNILSEVLHRWTEESISEAERHLAGTDAIVAFVRSLASRFGADRRVGEAVALHFSELPGTPVSEKGGNVRTEDRIRDWIESRLTEALPTAVPLVEGRPSLLALVLVCVFRGTLDEWVRGRQDPRSLDLAIQDRISYVLRAFGLPATVPESA